MLTRLWFAVSFTDSTLHCLLPWLIYLSRRIGGSAGNTIEVNFGIFSLVQMC